MEIDRRRMIAGAGASALVLAGGAGVWRVTRRPQTAHLPWVLDPKPPGDIRLDAFRHAILAPNPHNRQPWLIELDADDGATLYCDLAKRLPDTDPFDRQITIGFGTFLEVARMAAAERGVRIEMQPFPEGEPSPRLDGRPIAKLRFVADAGTPKDALFASIVKRRTNREIFDAARAVPDDLARKIADGRFATDAKRINSVRAITVAAMTIEQTTPHTFGESINLMRIGADEVDANPDGLVLAGPKMEALKLMGVLDKTALADQTSSAFKTGLEMQQEICGSIPALVWIVTPGNSRVDQLEAGRRYVRTNLRATAQGVAMHPLSQALQEYPEMAEKFAEIHKVLGVKAGQRLQMLARIGYAAPVGPAPRWPLETHFRA
jgi:Nitroreductase family